MVVEEDNGKITEEKLKKIRTDMGRLICAMYSISNKTFHFFGDNESSFKWEEGNDCLCSLIELVENISKIKDGSVYILDKNAYNQIWVQCESNFFIP